MNEPQELTLPTGRPKTTAGNALIAKSRNPTDELRITAQALIYAVEAIEFEAAEQVRRHSLDAAWQEAEAALPEGWNIRIEPVRGSDGSVIYRLDAARYENEPPVILAQSRDLAAALRALAAKLRERADR